MIIVIGRGASGTRLASKLFSGNGFYMGPCNATGDLVPPEDMYEAAKMAGGCVRLRGHHDWYLDDLTHSDPPDEYRRHVERYLAPILKNDPAEVGFKIPEALLSFPWLSKMFPDAHYLYWTRDPRDVVTRRHLTDRLSEFGVPSEYSDKSKIALCRIESYVYQRLLVEASPKPKRFLHVHYENYILNHTITLERISEFVGRELRCHEVLNRSKVTRAADFPKEELARFGYV